MNKIEFLTALRARLAGLPQADIDRTVDYYTEMIDDCMEEGFSSAEAVARMGSLDEIVAQARANTSAAGGIPPKSKKAPPPPPRQKTRAWMIVLLCVGFPLWFPLLLAAACVAFALLIVVMSLLIVFYAVDLILAAVAVACIFSSPFAAFSSGNPVQLFLLLGSGFLCAGLAIPLFFACNALIRKTVMLIKHIFIHHRKE